MATMASIASEETSLAHSREHLLGQGVRWLSTWALRWIIIVAAAYVLGRIVGLFWSVLLPIVIALVLTAALEPLVTLLRRRASFGPALASMTVLLTAFAVLGTGVYLLAPSIGDQATEIATSVSDGLTWLQDWVTRSDLATEAQVNEVIAAAQDRLQSSASTITQGVLVGLGAVTTFLINLVVIFVLSFFFLKDGERFLPWLGGVLGPRSGYHVVEVGVRAWDTLGTFVRTQALVGFIDAVLIGLALVIIGVPLAIPLAVLTFFAAFAPIVGAVVVGALAVVVALVSNGWIAALIILAVVLVVQQLEGNVLLPYLQGRSLDLHAAVVLLSIVLGSTLFGVIGAFAAVPVAAVGAVILRYVNEVVVARTPPPGVPDEVAGPPGTVSDPDAAAYIEEVREEEAAEQEWEAEQEWDHEHQGVDQPPRDEPSGGTRR
jgi:predicted PurR-regulated permease PerM